MLDRPPFRFPREEKETLLLERLTDLTAHHRAACPPYARMLDAFWPGADVALYQAKRRGRDRTVLAMEAPAPVS